MQISTARAVLKQIVARNRSPVALAGPPGIGKSRMVQEIANELGFEYRPVDMAFYQTEDLTGLPYREGDRTQWTKPSWFPEAGEGVLALEDANRVADPHVLNCLMGLLLDRRLHTHPLPPGWRVVVTLNVGSQFLTFHLDPAHISRLAIIEVRTDLDSVLAWGQVNGAHPLVLEFLRDNASYLFQLPAEDGQKPWPNPRSWLQGVGDNLPQQADQDCSPALMQALVSTFVGEQAAVAFVNWLFTASVCRRRARIAQHLQQRGGIV